MSKNVGGLSGSRADASSRQGVSTKGFDPGRGEYHVAFLVFRDAYMTCQKDDWESRILAGLRAAQPHMPESA